MMDFVRDLRYAIRMLVKNPGFTAVATLTLALGIGANTAVFSVVNGVLLRPLPYRDPDRLAILYEKTAQFDPMSVAYLNMVDWRERNRTFENIAGYRYAEFNLTGAGDPERLPGRSVSAGFFSILGIPLVAGREFLPQEDRPGGAPVVLITEGLWKRRFGRDKGVIGRALTLNGKRATVIGIVPGRFRFHGQSEQDEMFAPLGQQDTQEFLQRDFHPGIYVVGRMKRGVTLAQARSDLTGIGRQLAREYPASNVGHDVGAMPMKTYVVGDAGKTLWVLLGAVAFVLLIACANVANLLLARATVRQREVAIRTALGARRPRIIRQFLAESVLLSLVAGVLGLAIAAWGTDLAIRAIPQSVPRADEIGINGGVLAFTLITSMLTGIVFGIAPALQSAATAPVEVLKEAGRGLRGGRHRLRNALVVAEMALALVLLAGAGLMIRSLANLRGVHPGFEARDVLTFQVALSPRSTATAADTREAFRLLLARIASIPGIRAAAMSPNVPLSGNDSEVPLSIQGRPRPASDAEKVWAQFYPVTPDYLKVMRIPLLRGRFFDEHDGPGSRGVAVIDDVMARSVFPGEDPIGKVVNIEASGVERRAEIVGIVGHVLHWGLGADATAPVRNAYYMPFSQVPDQFVPLFSLGSTFMVRTSVNPLEVAAAVRREVIGAGRDQPVYAIRPMEEIVAESISRQRFSMALLAVFAAIALMLACVGIYGLTAYSVSQRTQEIGVRMALGAHRADVLRMVLREGAVLALAGVGIGLVVALAVTRMMSALLFGVSATDPLTFLAVAAALAGAALAASFIPARRAASFDPMEALRYE